MGRGGVQKKERGEVIGDKMRQREREKRGETEFWVWQDFRYGGGKREARWAREKSK